MRFRVTPTVKALRPGKVFVKAVGILEWIVENGHEKNIHENVNKMELW